MEGLSPLHRRVAGIDVHRMLHVVTVLIEQPDGSMAKHSREFGGFKRGCRALAAWLAELQVQPVVMQSTGIYWKSVFSHLENAGITAWVVNAHFIKHVPGRKTEALAASLDGDLSARHLFVLRHLSDTIDALQRQLADIDAYLWDAMTPYAWAHNLLQTIPGIDRTAAALILVEIGDDMARFASPERLASWAALSPGNHESAGKRKSGRTGHGNNTIRYILCECANAARMTKSTLAAKYKSLMVRKSHKKSIVALAHKMIRLIYILLTRRQPYIDQVIDYAAMSAHKNAPRWIKQLKAIGKWPEPKPAAHGAAA